MALDLGALVARVSMETVQFDRGYARVVSAMRELGATSETSAGGVRTLERSTAMAGGTAEKAAALTQRHARAIAEVGAVMADTASLTTREQRAVLSLTAAQDRLSATQESGTATTRQLAGAQASLIGATDRVAAAQRAAAAASIRQGETAASSSRGTSVAMAGMLKTAGQLGLAIGVFEAIKKAIDLTKQANEFQRSMVQIETNTGVAKSELAGMSDALLAMSGGVAAGPNELATSLYHVESVGLRGAKALDVVRIAAEGARVGNADLEQTTNALTSTVASGIRE
jgi:hypothetical protein